MYNINIYVYTWMHIHIHIYLHIIAAQRDTNHVIITKLHKKAFTWLKIE